MEMPTATIRSIIHVYETYKSNPFNTLTAKVFRKILTEVNKEIFNLVIFGADEVVLPYSLGCIRILKRPTIHENINNNISYIPKNWAETRKTGRVVLQLNEHRAGFKYSFYWRRDRKHANIKSFKFVACRVHKKTLAHVLKTMPEIDYMAHQKLTSPTHK